MIASRHRRHRRRHRHGFTLVEMLVVIATTSVICTLATSLIITMFRAEQNQTHAADERRAMQRLGDQFRSDVHAASAAPTFNEADDMLLRLPLSGGSEVTYRRDGGVIIREKHQGGTVVYHDTFGLSERWEVAIEPVEPSTPGELREPNTRGRLMRLSLGRTEMTQQSAAPERWQFEAVRGSDHRHDIHANLSE